jgi:FAD/FMN-containing dehydrogenase
MESINNELYEVEPNNEVAPSAKRVVRQLQTALSSCILLPANTDAFHASARNCFAQQSKTTQPACIVRPETTKQLGQAAAILHQEFIIRKADGHENNDCLGFVSLRSGGHSYARASASIDGGVLLDLSRLADVQISQDGSTVTVGTGARWSKVYKVLEPRKIAVPGGRNAAIGVGGFTLGGKSFSAVLFELFSFC